MVDDRAIIREEIDRIEAQFRAAIDRLRALLPADLAETKAGGDDDRWLEVSFAVERWGYPANTIRLWCRKGDGELVHGRWLVNIDRVEARLARKRSCE